jgi:hypothetical protein
MRTIVLRGFCCGVAAVVVSVPLFFFTMIWWTWHNTPPVPGGATGGGEVGVDVLSLVHNGPGVMAVWFLAVFAIGFLLGFRHFLKRSSPQTL